MALPSRQAATRYRRQWRPIGIALFLVITIYWIFWSGPDKDAASSPYQKPDGGRSPSTPVSGRPEKEKPALTTKAGKKTKEMIIAKMKADDTEWLFTYFPEWKKNLYVVDDPKAELTVIKNKGRESMVYLTYIIDNYDNLPDYMLFIHPQRYQWHNDDPYYDGKPVLENFQILYLEEQGYVNLRCTWALGCPGEIHPLSDMHRDDVHAGEFYKNGFMELFPDVEVPHEVGVSCCAQFGVTRKKIRERPKSDYERYRKWLLSTPLTDALSGRIMEYSWHMIFGKKSVHCPSEKECYCKVFGLCDLECPEVKYCKNRYVLPPYSTLPGGWPYKGWKGQRQDPSSGGLPES